jgi:hypothetical protein
MPTLSPSTSSSPRIAPATTPPFRPYEPRPGQRVEYPPRPIGLRSDRLPTSPRIDFRLFFLFPPRCLYRFEPERWSGAFCPG